jgi:predicted CopG family antitoxin
MCGEYMKADTVPDDMSDTSIRVSTELADELFDLKTRGESYEDVIWRLIEEHEDGE